MVSQNITDTMLTGKVSSVLLSLVVPSIIGMFSLLIINLIDAFYIGKLGVLALSAISFSFPVLFTVMSFNIGIAIGTSAIISKCIGSGQINDAKQKVSNILLLIFIFMCLVSICGKITITPLFKLLGADDFQLPLIFIYMKIWYLGAPFFGFLVIANSAIRATGDSITPSAIIFTTALVNAILDPILIFGLGPIDAMGIQGAAIATTLSYIAGMAGMLFILNNRELITFPNLNLRLLFGSCKSILMIGLPAGLTMMLNPIVLGYINKIVSEYGTFAVAAFGVGLRIESLATVGIIAISSSLTPFIGQNLGAKNFKRINSALNYCLIFSAIWGLFVAIPLILFCESFSKIFTNDIEVQNQIMLYLKIISLSYIFWGWSNIASAAFNGFQNPLNATIVFLGRLFVLTIPFVLLGDHLYGLSGIFIGISIANVLSGLVSIPWSKTLIKGKY